MKSIHLSAKTHHMNVDYSGYEGWEVTGKVKTVLLRGKIAIENNKCLLKKGYGQFIKRRKVEGYNIVTKTQRRKDTQRISSVYFVSYTFTIIDLKT